MINEMTSSRTDVRAFGGKIPIQHRREFLLDAASEVVLPKIPLSQVRLHIDDGIAAVRVLLRLLRGRELEAHALDQSWSGASAGFVDGLVSHTIDSDCVALIHGNDRRVLNGT